MFLRLHLHDGAQYPICLSTANSNTYADEIFMYLRNKWCVYDCDILLVSNTTHTVYVVRPCIFHTTLVRRYRLQYAIQVSFRTRISVSTPVLLVFAYDSGRCELGLA